jgi:hypothetical protein
MNELEEDRVNEVELTFDISIQILARPCPFLSQQGHPLLLAAALFAVPFTIPLGIVSTMFSMFLFYRTTCYSTIPMREDLRPGYSNFDGVPAPS